MRPSAALAVSVLLTFSANDLGAQSEASHQRLVQQLSDQGYGRISVSRTWLGRIRIRASAEGRLREIVIHPRTGEILRDYAQTGVDILREESLTGFAPASDGTGGGDARASGSGGGGGPGFDYLNGGLGGDVDFRMPTPMGELR